MAHKRLGVLIAVLFAVLSASGLEGWLSVSDGSSSSLNLTASVAYAGDPDDFQQGSAPDTSDGSPDPDPNSPAGDGGEEDDGRDSVLDAIIGFFGALLRL